MCIALVGSAAMRDVEFYLEHERQNGRHGEANHGREKEAHQNSDQVCQIVGHPDSPGAQHLYHHRTPAWFGDVAYRADGGHDGLL